MRGKLMFVLGASVGYVVGTRTGRRGYERLKSQASDLWLNPRVQETVSTVGDFAKEKIPVLGGTIAGASQKLTEKVRSDAEPTDDATSPNDTSPEATSPNATSPNA